jgi:hypothetical protein
VPDDTPFFIVGVPRSGTTLLRQLLRGHPRLAVPPESHFVPAALRAADGAAALQVVLGSEHFAEWSIDPAAVTEQAHATDMSPAAVVRSAFEAYAAAQDRPRWGDKTPAYLMHLPLLAQAFPGARFVHLVRDGREVAVSWRDAWWGPDDVLLAAHQWRRMINRSAADSERLPAGSRIQVRYDALVTDPKAELTRILAFLGEEMREGLLDSGDRSAADRSAAPREHRRLLEPPRPQVRDWRASCSPREQARVEALVGPTMRRLGLADDLAAGAWRRLDAEAHLLPRRAREWVRWRLRVRQPRDRQPRDRQH